MRLHPTARKFLVLWIAPIERQKNGMRVGFRDSQLPTPFFQIIPLTVSLFYAFHRQNLVLNVDDELRSGRNFNIYSRFISRHFMRHPVQFLGIVPGLRRRLNRQVFPEFFEKQPKTKAVLSVSAVVDSPVQQPNQQSGVSDFIVLDIQHLKQVEVVRECLLSLGPYIAEFQIVFEPSLEQLAVFCSTLLLRFWQRDLAIRGTYPRASQT